MFIREGELLRQLEHSHIVRCLAVLELPPDFPGLVRGYIHSTWALVLELLEGGSLCGLMHKQLLAPWKFLYDNASALDWSIQVASALTFLHGCSPPVIQRDIKMDNVMLGTTAPDGSKRTVAKLVDLGLHTRPLGLERCQGETLLRAAMSPFSRRARSDSSYLAAPTCQEANRPGTAAAGCAAGAAVPATVMCDASVRGNNNYPRPATAPATVQAGAATSAAALFYAVHEGGSMLRPIDIRSGDFAQPQRGLNAGGWRLPNQASQRQRVPSRSRSFLSKFATSFVGAGSRKGSVGLSGLAPASAVAGDAADIFRLSESGEEEALRPSAELGQGPRALDAGTAAGQQRPASPAVSCTPNETDANATAPGAAAATVPSAGGYSAGCGGGLSVAVLVGDQQSSSSSPSAKSDEQHEIYLPCLQLRPPLDSAVDGASQPANSRANTAPVGGRLYAQHRVLGDAPFSSTTADILNTPGAVVIGGDGNNIPHGYFHSLSAGTCLQPYRDTASKNDPAVSPPGCSTGQGVSMQPGLQSANHENLLSRPVTAREVSLDLGSFDGSMEVVYRLTGETGSCMTMAPEIRLQQPYNEKIDVYAFGVIMYEIWSRSLLAVSHIGTKRPDLPGILHKCEDWPDTIVSGYRPARIEAIPDPIWQLITDCWHQDPLVRPAMAAVEARLRCLAVEQAEAVVGLSSGKGGKKLPAARTAAGGGVAENNPAGMRFRRIALPPRQVVVARLAEGGASPSCGCTIS